MERTRKLVIAEALYFDMEDLKQSECVKKKLKRETERNRDRDRETETERQRETETQRERIIYSFRFVCHYFMCFLCAS